MDTFSYEPRFQLPTGLPATIQLEPGVQGGDLPNERLDVRSYVAEAIELRGATVGCEDESAFGLRVLHFSRTFLEKLFAVHGLVVRLEQTGTPLGRDARHYHDLFELAARDEVVELLKSEECQTIRRDVDRVSRAFYADRYSAPKGLRLRGSPCIDPPDTLRPLIAADYERECSRLCYDGHYAPFDSVLERLRGLGDLL